MNFAVKVLKKTEAMDGDSVTIGLPDENGQIIELKGEAEGDLNALVPGAMYTLAFVPMVVPQAPVEPTEAPVVPVEHPVVIAPEDAAGVLPAEVEDVVVITPPEAVVEAVGDCTEPCPEAPADAPVADAPAPKDPPATA